VRLSTFKTLEDMGVPVMFGTSNLSCLLDQFKKLRTWWQMENLDDDSINFYVNFRGKHKFHAGDYEEAVAQGLIWLYSQLEDDYKK
jgi:hypothetical protein